MGAVKLLGGVGGRSSGHQAVCQSAPRRPVQCARSRKRAPRCTGKSVGEVLDQGSNGGGPPPPPELPPTREEDGGDGQKAEQEIDAVLAKAGADASSLPKDIQAAIGTGMASAADIQAYLRAASLPLVGWICRIFPAFRDRVLGNPRFLLQLAIEEFLGVAGKMTAEVQYRGDRFWKELHFVASDIALEIVGNFFLVWLMSPKVSFKPAATSKLARAVAALPGNVGQTGAFTLNQRLATVLYRGCQFFCVGFVSSVTGHSFTRYLLQQQAAVAVAKAEEEAKRSGKKKADKTPEEQAVAELAPVLDNSLGWAAFMSVNSNLRYQLVNTVEERVIARMVASNALASMMILVMRFCNTAVGGQQWVMFAQAIGLQ